MPKNSNFVVDLKNDTISNKNYRKVIHTSPTQQVVLMNIPYKEEIGMEVHHDISQFFYIVKGVGNITIDGQTHKVSAGDMVVVDPGLEHNVVSLSRTGLRLFTIYSPPEHPPNTIQKTKPKRKNE